MAIVFGIGKLMVNDEEVGILQDVSLDISTSYQELRGGGSLFPVAQRASEREVTGSAEYAEIDGKLLHELIGGSWDETEGKLTMNENDSPSEFSIELEAPTDGSNVVIKLPRCVSESMDMSFTFDDFTMPSFDFSALSTEDGKVMEIDVPTE